MTTYLPWHQMSDREQQVWACIFANQNGGLEEAARLADRTVLKLRALNMDDQRFFGPENDASRNCPGLTYEEFRNWYPIALKIAKRGHITPQEIGEEACEEAFETYQRSAADFY